MYIATGNGTFSHFTDRNGDPISISDPNSLTVFFRSPDRIWWETQELRFDMSEYRKKSAPISFASSLPPLNYYPYSLETADNYDKVEGILILPEGTKSVTSSGEIFGEIIYKNCTHILLGFSLSKMTYFEVATGRRMILASDTKEIIYGTPISDQGTDAQYIKICTYDISSSKIDIYESYDGNDFSFFATVDVGSESSSEHIHFRSIGYYEPEPDGHSKIIFTGSGDRLMLENIPTITEPAFNEDMEILVPADNIAGLIRRVIRIPQYKGRFHDKKILVYGDSITAEFGVEAGTYRNILMEKFESDQIILHGYPGYELSGTGFQGESLTQTELLDKIIAEEPYLVIISGGTNDYWHYTTPGSPATDTETDYTISGGLKYIINYLNSKLYGTANIMVCTPPPGFYDGRPDTAPNDKGYTMSDYVSAIKAVSGLLHIPVCDIWSNANWAASMENKNYLFTTDGLHLSIKGYRKISELQYRTADKYIF